MKRKKKPLARSDYEERVRKLRSFGFHPSYRIGRKNTGAAKGAVTRAWKKHQYFLAPREGTQPVKFKRASKRELKIARQVLSSEAVTPGGFFLMVPRGVRPSDYDMKIKKGRKGVRAVVEESIRGLQKDVVIRPEWRELVMDPRGHIIELVTRQKQDAPRRRVRGKMRPRKLRGVKIVVGGMESHSNMISPSSLADYTDDLFENFVGSEDEYESASDYNRRAREFVDKFQLRFIYE